MREKGKNNQQIHNVRYGKRGRGESSLLPILSSRWILKGLSNTGLFDSQVLRVVKAKQSAETLMFCWCFCFFFLFFFYFFFFFFFSNNTGKIFSKRTLGKKQLSSSDKDVTSCSSCSLPTTGSLFPLFFIGNEWDALKMFLQPMHISAGTAC